MMHLRVALISCIALVASVLNTSAQSFFDNYLKPQFLVPVLDFPATSGGDGNLTYYQIQIPALPNGELLILGEFPRARYFSITAYDDHGAVIGILNDRDIRAYGTTANPWVPGGPAGAEDLLYAVSVRLGAQASTPQPSCATPLNVHENSLDLTQRHTAGTFYSAQQRGFSATVTGYGNVTHADAPVNTGGFLLIRSYMREASATTSQFDLRKPLVWVRHVATGCAVQLAPAGQYLAPSQWFSLASVLKLDQAYAHMQHEIDLGTTTPHGPDPSSEATWYGPGRVPARSSRRTLPGDRAAHQHHRIHVDGRGPQCPGTGAADAVSAAATALPHQPDLRIDGRRGAAVLEPDVRNGDGRFARHRVRTACDAGRKRIRDVGGELRHAATRPRLGG